MDQYIGENQDPMQEDCCNPSQENHFTCPGCFADLEGKPGVQRCGCGAVVACSNEVPSERNSVARMIRVEDAGEYEVALAALGIEVPDDAS